MNSAPFNALNFLADSISTLSLSDSCSPVASISTLGIARMRSFSLSSDATASASASSSSSAATSNTAVDEDQDNEHVSLADHVDVTTLVSDSVGADGGAAEGGKENENANGVENVNGAENGAGNGKAPKALGETVLNSKTDGKSSDDSSSSSTGLRDVRIAVVGNVDSGKSTLVGVLTGGALDDGRGLARSRVFVHAHEHSNGRTSCISQHIMGYDENLTPVHQLASASASAAAKTKSWTQVVNNSKSVVTFVDLAGHEKYLRTTIAGLTGCHPDYALVIINSLAGITKMTKEHLGVVLALGIPLICVVTKVDMAPENVLARTKTQLFKILKSGAANEKMPLQMRNAGDVQMAIDNQSQRICPVFFISSVTGVHIPLLHSYLARLTPRRAEWLQKVSADSSSFAGIPASSSSTSYSSSSSSSQTPNPETAAEFSIDETFNVTGVGVVVSGTVQRGVMVPNMNMVLGPYSDGSFKPVYVRTLHCKRMNTERVEAGDSCAVSIRAVGRKEHLSRALIRRGMILADPLLQPQSTSVFEAEVHILHHPTTIKLGYQAVVHAGMIRQAATMVNIAKQRLVVASTNVSTGLEEHSLRTGDRAIVRFRFLLRPEFLHTGITFIFREGSTKGVGRVTKVHFTDAELKAQVLEEERAKSFRSKPLTKGEKASLRSIALEHIQQLTQGRGGGDEVVIDLANDGSNSAGAGAASSAAGSAGGGTIRKKSG